MKEDLTFPICITLMVLALITSVSYYHISDRKLMSQNIDSAIAKGIDPLSVRCSYASHVDAVCVAYTIQTTPGSFTPTTRK
jgi:hypothetical protein